MKIVIENAPYGNGQKLREFGSIIRHLKSDAPIQETFSLLTEKYEDSWFFYQGGNHIAVHQRYLNSDEIDDDRVLLVEL